MSNTTRLFLSSMLLLLLIALLSGCQSNVRPTSAVAPSTSKLPSPTTPISARLAQPEAAAEGQEARQLHQCQQQLKILKTLQAESYLRNQRAFDQLMRNAAQYASLRTNVNESTQDTVDALYHYRVNLLCAQINQAVLTRLAEQGGATL